MKYLLPALLLILPAMGIAQITRKEAEWKINNSSLAPRIDKEVLIWSMTASDAELAAALANPTTEKAKAAAMELKVRRRPALVAALIKALPHADANVGMEAVMTLSSIDSPDARHAVERATKNPVREVRWLAAERSSIWGYRGGADALAEAVRNYRIEAVTPLGKVGTPAHIPALKEFYAMANATPRRERASAGSRFHQDQTAVLAMARLSDSQSIDDLRHEIEHHTDKFFRTRAVEVLGELRRNQDIPLITAALKDEYMNVRFAAAEALWRAQAKSAVAVMRDVAKVPGVDASQGKSSDRIGRMYIALAADSIEKGAPFVTQQQWHNSPEVRKARWGR